jgi:hypothetical protein
MWTFSKALCTNLHYLPEPEVEYLPVNRSVGVQSAQSKKTNTAAAYWSHDKTTEPLTRSQFGMTLLRLQDAHGLDLLTLYQAAFPVRTLVAQGLELVSRAQGQDSGVTCTESFAKFDPVLCSWRTLHCSLLGDSVEFSETWPRSGTMQNGECWERTQLERHTDGIESGYWPTPLAGDNRDRGHLGTPVVQRRIKIGKQVMLSQCVSETSGALNPNWVEWLMGWPIGHTDLQR